MSSYNDISCQQKILDLYQNYLEENTHLDFEAINENYIMLQRALNTLYWGNDKEHDKFKKLKFGANKIY